MPIVRKSSVNRMVTHTLPTEDYDILDDVEALTTLVQKSFDEAAKKAVAENDALGIQTHGSVDGKLVVRIPPKNNAIHTLR
ncbi:MAG: hypothetical protein HQL05_14305 [Nitrospirae bacterium]|nr:hypothetical protein [Nitrospirota bacterium]